MAVWVGTEVADHLTEAGGGAADVACKLLATEGSEEGQGWQQLAQRRYASGGLMEAHLAAPSCHLNIPVAHRMLASVWRPTPGGLLVINLSSNNCSCSQKHVNQM